MGPTRTGRKPFAVRLAGEPDRIEGAQKTGSHRHGVGAGTWHHGVQGKDDVRRSIPCGALGRNGCQGAGQDAGKAADNTAKAAGKAMEDATKK